MADDTRNLSAKYKIPTPHQIDVKAPVMVLEDQMDLRLIVAHHLQKLGFATVRQVDHGLAGVETIKSQGDQIAVYVCDMDMPVMSGLDFLGELRETPELDRAPFCLMMDNVSKEKLMLAVESGVDEILVKPFTLNDIVPKLRAAFAKFHNPSNPERVYELAKTMLRRNDLDQAETIYKDLATVAQNSARPLVGLARIAERRGDLDKALVYLAEAETNNVNYVHIYSERARILASRQDWQGAIEGFRKAIDLSPLNAIRYKAAADILFKEQRYPEAVELLELALRHHLEFPAIYHYLSQAKFALRDYKAAQKYVRQALATDPENPLYLNQLGVCLKETQQLDEAVKVYNQVIKADPGNCDALYNKAILMKTKGDLDEAIKLLERLLRKTPDFGPAKAKLDECQRDLQNKKAS